MVQTISAEKRLRVFQFHSTPFQIESNWFCSNQSEPIVPESKQIGKAPFSTATSLYCESTITLTKNKKP